MTNGEAVKNAYLFSCFCGLRISDIIGLKWKNVYIDNGPYRLEVVMQKTKVILKPWTKAAGIEKHFAFHAARHPFATMMLTPGEDLYMTFVG